MAQPDGATPGAGREWTLSMPAMPLAPKPFTGIILATVALLVVIEEWAPSPPLEAATAIGALVVTILLSFGAKRLQLFFVVIAAVLTVIAALAGHDWLATSVRGAMIAAFISAFFTALSTLRNAADTSPGIQECGRYLAQQPPGRRYIALTVGGSLFALVLNYGSIALLGSLAMSSANHEKNEEIRAIRIRRMLLAIQRGFITALPWSPLSFAIAVSTTLVPDATWAGGIVPCFVSGVIIGGIGWAMDTIYKPKLSGPRPVRQPSDGSIRSVTPLVLLLLILGTVVAALHLLTGHRVVILVIMLVPIVAGGWIALQARKSTPIANLAIRARRYVAYDLPSYRGEILLLMMAGYIGTVGSHLLAPLVEASGIDLATLPPQVILVALVWAIPLAGQFGMNPILAVSLMAPLLPSATELGISPTAILVAITSGWALGGASSPFTATTLLVGSFAGKSATHVGLRWNGAYTLICAVALSIWVAIYSFIA
ncbi:hypothetical protein L1787_00945 [Acuticoccus sp. M5D2P5]|uniref:hypothetical protein n=1 Tax=Acuticoccus kalidii TaxID=2910977 RepID=UPI001F3BF6DA|nr:hypothetical protein [Acuticoccus kalidii]MCF3931978.1 hypothetical protein [Acuticoccus kalidii]